MAPVHMRILESEVKAARHERQWSMATVEPGLSWQRAPSMLVDPEEALLRKVMRCSLTTAETDAKRLRWKNTKRSASG